MLLHAQRDDWTDCPEMLICLGSHLTYSSCQLTIKKITNWHILTLTATAIKVGGESVFLILVFIIRTA